MKAWELLSKPGSWCQGSLAMDINNNPTSPSDPQAIKFCALGALAIIYSQADAFKLEMKLQRLLYSNLSLWNDANGRTQEQVVAKLKELDI